MRPILAAFVAFAGCCTVPSGVPASPITLAEAQAVLDAQVAAWNRGDLPTFVQTYWDGEQLTFLGSNGIVHGRADLLDKYQRAYDTPEKRGTLSFSVSEFTALGADHALLLGHYELQRSQPDHGWFSLVLARQGGKVVILHDHTSQGR